MLSRVRKRFTYTNVVMTLALMFAMAGGAYAAKHYLITSLNQVSPKAKNEIKKLAGVPRTGPAGQQGPQGAPGTPGAPGTKGETGSAGASGVSVTSGVLAKGNASCKEGGSEFTAAENKKTVACNGKEGSPWTAKGVLPAGSSEHGQWVLAGVAGGRRLVGISFPIPISEPLPSARAHLIGVEEGKGEAKEAGAIASGECTGTWQEPGAASENMCIFVSPLLQGAPPKLNVISDAESEGEFAVGKSGAVFGEGNGTEEKYFYQGSWVVTG
jgi:hypothetical protein